MDRTGHWNAAATTTAGIVLGVVGTSSVAAAGAGEIQAGDWLQFFGTLLGALMAVGAAVAAATPVYRQMDLLKRQTAAATISAISTAATEFQTELEAIQNDEIIANELGRILGYTFEKQPRDWHDTTTKMINFLKQSINRTEICAIRRPGTSETMRYARIKFVDSGTGLIKALENLYIVAKDGRIPDFDERKHLNDAWDRYWDWVAARNQANELIELETKKYWSILHKMERDVFI